MVTHQAVTRIHLARLRVLKTRINRGARAGAWRSASSNACWCNTRTRRIAATGPRGRLRHQVRFASGTERGGGNGADVRIRRICFIFDDVAVWFVL